MVHTGCVFVVGIHLSRTWVSGCFEMECMCAQTRPQFILSSKSLGGMESETMLTPREKSPLPEAWTHSAASHRTVSPAHYQMSYSSSPIATEVLMFKSVLWHSHGKQASIPMSPAVEVDALLQDHQDSWLRNFPISWISHYWICQCLLMDQHALWNLVVPVLHNLLMFEVKCEQHTSGFVMTDCAIVLV